MLVNLNHKRGRNLNGSMASCHSFSLFDILSKQFHNKLRGKKPSLGAEPLQTEISLHLLYGKKPPLSLCFLPLEIQGRGLQC
jgi:hypothetical protein